MKHKLESSISVLVYCGRIS